MIERYALIVSINDYTLIDKTGRTNLRGCLNDGADYQRLCRSTGYKPENVHVLKDRAATYQNIVEEMMWLASKLNESPENEGLFANSSHGSTYQQKPILCPADMDWNNPLTFHKIGEILKIREGVDFTSFLDCCHSGARFREALNGYDSGYFDLLEEDVTGRYLAPPPELEDEHAFFDDAVEEGERALPAPGASVQLTSDRDIVLAGCSLSQTSADAYISGSYHGAMTYYLMRLLENTPFVGGTDGYFRISYSELISRLQLTLRKNGYTQTPQYQGPDAYQGLMVFQQPGSRKV